MEQSCQSRFFGQNLRFFEQTDVAGSKGAICDEDTAQFRKLWAWSGAPLFASQEENEWPREATRIHSRNPSAPG
jgi:hypothetical protein